MIDTISEIQDVIRYFFMDDELHISSQTTAPDVLGWDSLANINLMVAIEKRFAVKFTAREIEKFENVGDMARAIEAKR